MEAYSLGAKAELARMMPKETCCRLAELSALVRMTGSLHLAGRQEVYLVLKVENAAVARKIIRLLKAFFQLNLTIVALKHSRLKKRRTYEIRIPDHERTEDILTKLLLKDGGGLTFQNLPAAYLARQCCQRAFMRGCFLAGGSVTDPERKSYHLEILPGTLDFGENIMYLMNLIGVRSGLGWRKGVPFLYIKDSEAIIKFLSLIGAHTALLRLEEVRTTREMRGGINRLVNCETANLNKTVQASVEQVEKIRLLQRELGLHKLPDKLKELAFLRLDNPESSLKELSEMTNPKSTKSAVNHRMRKLLKMADEYE